MLATLALAAALGITATAHAQKRWPDGNAPVRQARRPRWLDTPDAVLDVRWVRARGAAEVRGGVCVLALADDTEHDLHEAEAQVLACLRSGAGTSGATSPAGAVRLHWHQVDTRADVAARFDSVFPGLARPMDGFYDQPDPAGPCHVVTARVGEPALGHEIKHCFDGHFHGALGRWKR